MPWVIDPTPTRSCEISIRTVFLPETDVSWGKRRLLEPPSYPRIETVFSALRPAIIPQFQVIMFFAV